MNIDLRSRQLLDRTQAIAPSAGPDAPAGAADSAPEAKRAPSFESLLESLQRLRQTGEAATVEALDSDLEAADALHEEARALSQRLREAFRARLADLG